MILQKIVEHKRVELAERMAGVTLPAVQHLAASAPLARGFAAALKNDGPAPAVIAEIKKASPSKGVIREDFDPRGIAREYEAAGASVISVLTDEKFFQGSLDYLRVVRGSVSLPVLRKDFLIAPYQIWEARAAGADAVLLIAAILPKDELSSLLALTHELGMEALVEVHTEEEVKTAVGIGAGIIGINNRDLRTFRVALDTTLRLLPMIPAGRVVVSESGIATCQDARFLRERGVHAVLIGEALMREPHPGEKLREILG